MNFSIKNSKTSEYIINQYKKRLITNNSIIVTRKRYSRCNKLQICYYLNKMYYLNKKASQFLNKKKESFPLVL